MGAPRATAARVSSVQDLPATKTRQVWLNNQWQDTSRIRYTRFDAAGHNTERFLENPAGGWRPYQKRHQTFNAQGLQVADTIFSGTSGLPLVATRRTYTASQKPDSIVTRWKLGTMWRYYSRDTYAYDAADNPLTLLWENNAGGWYYDSKFFFVTDPLGRIIADEQQGYDDASLTWYPENATEYTYTAADSVLTQNESEWKTSTGAYEPVRRLRHHYNSLGQLDSTYHEAYDTLTFSYKLYALSSFQYNARGNRTLELIQQGSTLASQQNAVRYVSAYTITGLAAEALTAASLTLVPNPAAAGRTALRYELKTAAPVAVEIVDQVGRRVGAPLTATTQAAGAHSLTLDVRALPAGLYLVRLTAGTDVRQTRLVVQ